MIEKIYQTKNKDLRLFKMKKFIDNRGFFEEIFNELEFRKKLKINFKAKLVCSSTSKKNVLRGFHYYPQQQMIYVKKGKILDVVIDIRKKSKFFGRYEKFILSESNQKMLFMPEGFAHAFYTLEQENIIIYNVSKIYNKKLDNGLIWNDPIINFPWPSKKPILSKKDKSHPFFNDIKF